MPLPQQITLGGRRVHRVGYGAMQLTDLDGLAVHPDHATELLETALDHGVTLIDTAEFYGHGTLNRLLGKVLAGRQDVVVATKIGAREDPEVRLRPAQQPGELRTDVERNLRSLGVDRLDLVFLRRTDAAPGIIATGDQVVNLDDQLAELIRLRDEGKIAAIGLSNVSVEQLDTAAGADIAAVQNAYSLADRTSEPVLDACREQGVAWMPYFPLGGNHAHLPSEVEAELGLDLTSVTGLPGVRAIAAELGLSPSQLGLAWHLHHYEHAVLIPGTRSLDHLAENIAVADIELPREVMARLLDA